MRFLLGFALIVAGCYSPSYGDCQVSCASSQQCPSGLKCDGTVCRDPGVKGPCLTPDASDAAARTVPIEMFEQAYLEALCEYGVRCGAVDDVPTCLSLNGAAFTRFGVFDNPLAAVAQNKVMYDGNAAQACIDSFAQSTCNRDRNVNDGDTTFACSHIFVGTIGADATCAIDQECISQVCTASCQSNTCCTGTCVGATPPALRQVTDRCSEADRCVDSWCDLTDPTLANHVCKPRKTTGMTCSRTNECVDGSYCKYDQQTNLQSCQPLSVEGSACMSGQDCLLLSNVCVNGQCTTGGLIGFTCTMNGTLLGECQGSYICSSGSCQLPPSEGQPCPQGVCRESVCNGNTCVPYKANGDSCTAASFGQDCASGYCDPNTSTCAARPICT